MSIAELDLSRLSVNDRLDLIARLWDSIPDDAASLPMPQWHREELERRLQAADESPDAGEPWESLRDRLREKR